MNEIIRLSDVGKVDARGRYVIHDVDLSVRGRECVHICGGDRLERDALMRLMAGMERPSAGRIIVLGHALHDMDAGQRAAFRNTAFGICPREPSLMPTLTVWENVALPLAVRGVPAPQRKRAAKEQLRTLGIRPAAYAYPAQLTLLEAQIASIARAWITRPPVLLIEDLTAGLSARQGEEAGDIIRVLSAFGETAVVCFTSGAFAFGADKRYLLEHGTIREETI